MFKEIENAAIDRVKNSSLGPLLRSLGAFGEISNKTLKQLALQCPGVWFAITEGRFERQTVSKYKLSPELIAWCGARDMGSQGQKRTKPQVGAYAIFETVVGLLAGQDLGLGITPLAPKSFGCFDDEDIRALGMSIYWVRFETGWTVQKVGEGEATYLDGIGIDYFVKPGDDVADASDEITFQQ